MAPQHHRRQRQPLQAGPDPQTVQRQLAAGPHVGDAATTRGPSAAPAGSDALREGQHDAAAALPLFVRRQQRRRHHELRQLRLQAARQRLRAIRRRRRRRSPSAVSRAAVVSGAGAVGVVIRLFSRRLAALGLLARLPASVGFGRRRPGRRGCGQRPAPSPARRADPSTWPARAARRAARSRPVPRAHPEFAVWGLRVDSAGCVGARHNDLQRHALVPMVAVDARQRRFRHRHRGVGVHAFVDLHFAGHASAAAQALPRAAAGASA